MSDSEEVEVKHAESWSAVISQGTCCSGSLGRTLTGIYFVFVAEVSRKIFVDIAFKGKLPRTMSTGHITVKRASIYDDAISAYSTRPKLVNQCPLSVNFDGEEGVDLGGLSRDFFTGFWEEAYVKMFDGAALLTPLLHPNMDISQFAILGQILSHGYLCCGFIPTRICFPVLAFVLLGLCTTIPRPLLVDCFSDFLTEVDRKAIAKALEAKEFTPCMKTNVINILSRFGCRGNANT